MKKHFTQILSIFLSGIMLTGAAAFSAGAAPKEQQRFTEITVKKSEILQKGAFKAIQSALNAARYSATKDNRYKIIVEPGSYDLRSALHIYSNTTLSLYNVVFVRNKEAVTNMIRTGEDTAVNKGDSGYAANANISIEGGTLDGNGTSNTMIKVTHASNFSMVGTEVCNLRNAHMMEVAAVDGMQVRSCTFKDQVLENTGDNVGYEAIQLDIPKSGHIVGTRSEALNMKHVHIEGCIFSNCPRGIGSHTQILNLPFDGITIANNTFEDMKSAAIQGENWKNVTITGNRISKTPRAIAMYALIGGAAGGFRASVLAEEGNTSTKVSDSYQKPYNANILIADNQITDCGNIKDIYADYEPSAVSLIGTTLAKAGNSFSNGAGGYPAGEYYITGVTVRNNKISTGGNAVYLEQVRNVNVIENEMTCSKSKFATKTCNPLTTLNCAVASVSGNIVKSSSEQGFEIAISTVREITGNHIANVKVDGILLEAESRVTEKISGNIITKAARYGLNLRPKCGGGTVSGNIIYDCAKGAIQKEKTATGTVGDNYYEIAEMSKLTLNTQSATLGAGETFALSTSYEPANAIADMQWTSSDPKVANVSTKGVITAQQYGEADISVKSGKKTASCHVKVMPAPESIKLSANMLTIGYGEKVDLDGRLTEGTFSHSITYTSNNKNAVTVNSSDGVIKGVGTGTATIIAKTFNGKHAACNVIVKNAPDDIWFDSRELDLGIGEKALLHVNLPDGSASHAMKWHSDNEAVIKVTEHGELSALDVGEATVTATAFNGAKAICYVTVLDAPDKVRFAEEVYTLTAGDSMTPTVYFPEGATSHALQFQSSDPDICRVNKLTGELTAKKSGIVTITVKTFNRRFTSCTVVVHSSAAGTSGGYE